jgi:uncharacterized membrane protein
MPGRPRLPLILFAVGMIGLGVLALIYGDFALVWQPVPAWVPGRTALAYLSGVVMLVGGIGLLIPRATPWAARVLLVYLVLWVLLKVPALFVTPLKESVWLGVGELTVLLAGGWVLWATRTGPPERSLRLAQIVLGVSLIPIGLSHIVYVGDTADLVPTWLPYRTAWAYLTGVAHMAAGLAVMLSVVPRLAAMMEAAMLSAFTVLVWIPAIVAAPTARLPWTAFFISWAITAAAWVVAESITATPLRTTAQSQSAAPETAPAAQTP